MNFNQWMKKKQRLLGMNQKGMTLMEIMVVIVIIGIIGTVAVTNINSSLQKAKVDSTKQLMRNLGTALSAFKMDCHSFPTTEQGIKVLLASGVASAGCKNANLEGYLNGKEEPRDPYGQLFIYESDGSTYELISKGKDGKVGGTEGYDVDISSKDLE